VKDGLKRKKEVRKNGREMLIRESRKMRGYKMNGKAKWMEKNIFQDIQ
jgi:hypothetical protein